MRDKYLEHTDTGGLGRGFETTRWTAIEAIRSKDDSHKCALVGKMLALYWKPVYWYLRQKGNTNEQAKDLTQGFFQEVVLGHELIQQADQAKGRFRTFLLTALDRYVTSEYRKETARKRIPTDKLLSLDHIESGNLAETIGGFTSEESFNYVWVSELLDQMIKEVEEECHRRKMSTHWKVFRDRVLRPIMAEKQPASMMDICNQYGIESPTKASSMIIAVKRRFQATLRRHLRQFVTSDVQISEEIRELVRFLKKKPQ